LPAGIAGDEYVAAPGETISLVGYWAQCTDTLDIVVEGDATSLPEMEAQTVCNGQTAFLRVVNPDPNVLYRWEPWGETGNEIVVAATQTLVATLVYENSACRYNSTFTFDVFPTPDLSVTAIPTCFNRHLTLELTGSEMQIFMTDGLGWNENFSLNGTSIVVYRPETPGEYVLTIESINAYDCGDTSTITFVTDARLPTLQITLPDSWCESTPPIPVFSPSGGTLYVDGTVRSDLAGLTPGNHTIYYVVQSDECVLDTALNIVVLPMPMEPVITGPTEICHGEKAALYSNVPVLWYRNHIEIGGPSMEISVDKEGKYKAVVINECGQTQKIWEVSLSQPKTVSYQGPEIQPCVNESAVWRASGADRYRWILPDGEMLDGSEVSFRLESPGIVTLIGFNGACSDTTFVPVNPRQPETLSIKTVCDSVVTGGSVWMSLEKDYENVFWTNESGDTISMGRELIVTPLATSDFFVHGECALGRIRIVVDDGWYVPNIFTPNRDGVNDVFFVRSVRPKDFHLIVFDRWGTIMFETKSYSHGWDGHFNGKDAAEGVYFYLLKATYCGSATTSVKGQFTLTR
jgi:gliding motility-associated-like protein